MKQLAFSLAALTLIVALEGQSPAAGPPSPAPWQPRPVIIIDPRPYLSSPSPHPVRSAAPHLKRRATPHPRATPARRHPATARTPEVFDRIDTSPSPAPHRHAR